MGPMLQESELEVAIHGVRKDEDDVNRAANKQKHDDIAISLGDPGLSPMVFQQTDGLEGKE